MQLVLLVCVLCTLLGLSMGSVLHLKNEKDFATEVTKFPGVVLVEFYAPWCGHCKSLEPEFKKAAKALDGVVKLVAVDATVHGGLAQKYGVQGYPTLKMFGLDKKKPTDYAGQRKSDEMISGCMKAANAMVKDRKAGKKGSPTSSPTTKPKVEPNVEDKPKPDTGSGSESKRKPDVSDVVTLTADNFEDLVLNSDHHWMVEFYAPWCGHCKNLAPEWEEAAQKLSGQVKLGMVDATAHESLGSKYGIKGFPSIKLFGAGKKGKPVDYQGGRDATAIVEYSLKTLDDAGVPLKTPQVIGKKNMQSDCTDSKICVIMFVPHILDSGAKERV